MPAARKDLGADFQPHPDDLKKVHCIPCNSDLLRTSISAHITSQKHVSGIERSRIRLEQQQREHTQAQQLYNALPTLLRAPETLQPPQTRADLVENSQGNFSYSMDPMDEDPINNQLWEDDACQELEREEELHRQYIALLEAAQHLDIFGTEDEDTELGSHGQEEYRNDDDEGVNDTETGQSGTGYQQGMYAPYPNKPAMLLDLMDNLPRLRLSNDSIRLILWMLQELGVREVPSYNKFRKLQGSLRTLYRRQPLEQKSFLGNIFSVNSIGDSIAQDFSNPNTASHLHLYPEECDGYNVSESWQAERWKEFGPSKLTPMIVNADKQFYIGEIARISDRRLVLPQRWYTYKGDLYGDCLLVETFAGNKWTVPDPATMHRISAESFIHNYEDLAVISHEEVSQWKDLGNGFQAPTMPNELRKLADGADLCVVMVPVWCDDVSGNKSKQYNKHINLYAVNGCLPGQMLQQEYHLKFVSTSPDAASSEQFAAIRDEVKKTETTPIRTFNAHTGRECAIILRIPGLPADNPQQSEEASHMGQQANKFCRKCDAGGSQETREQDEVYHALHCMGILRTAAGIRAELKSQLETAMTGSEKDVKLRQTESGTKDKFTEHWISKLFEQQKIMRNNKAKVYTNDEITTALTEWLDAQPGLDPTQDTPVEILHTILLGIVKYVWHILHTTLTEKQRELFTIRLQSSDVDGLTTPTIRAAYIMQYRNNLIGKHFKTLMQLLPFHIHELSDKVSAAHLNLFKAVGALGAVLWYHNIADMASYVDDLQVLVDNVLDAFGQVDSTKILHKVKIHLLPHLVHDIPRFGPAIRSSTEVYESFNAVFRLCSIYSNHQAPSRDIAMKFISMDRVKHIFSGGYYQVILPGEEDKQWVQASERVQSLLLDKSVIQRHLGWAPKKKETPGIVHVKSWKDAKTSSWAATRASKVQGFIPTHLEGWNIGHSVHTTSGDVAKIGSWVFSKDREQAIAGRVLELLTLGLNGKDSEGLVTLEIFEILEHQHPQLNCPILRRREGASQYAVFPSQDLWFVFSAQHDCRAGKCAPTAFRMQRQERKDTTRIDKLIEHANNNQFIVNMFALHNAELLREVLPRSLIKPVPLYTDRRRRHNEIAAQLRIDGSQKRAETNAKRKRTRQANKAKAGKRALAAQAAEASRLHTSKDQDAEGDGKSQSSQDSGNEDDSGQDDNEQEEMDHSEEGDSDSNEDMSEDHTGDDQHRKKRRRLQ